MRMIGILLLITFLSGCTSINLAEKSDEERCVLSVEFQKCRCHQYRVSASQVGRVSESVDRPIEYCEDLVGFQPKAWVRYVIWIEDVFQAVEDHNNLSEPLPMVETPDDIMGLVIQK